MKPTFFATPEAMRAWLRENHATAAEVLVGFYKKGSGRQSITWPESVDEALCVGWIDGIRRGVDDERYTIRFTPRKAGSIWSAVNIKRVEALQAAGLMQPAGLAAFAKRKEARSAVYAYEQREQGLSAEYEERFKANRKAWEFFQAQAAWYQRNAAWWVISAKREETRQKRLAQLIDDSAHGRTIRHMTRATKQGKEREKLPRATSATSASSPNFGTAPKRGRVSPKQANAKNAKKSKRA